MQSSTSYEHTPGLSDAQSPSSIHSSPRELNKNEDVDMNDPDISVTSEKKRKVADKDDSIDKKASKKSKKSKDTSTFVKSDKKSKDAKPSSKASKSDTKGKKKEETDDKKEDKPLVELKNKRLVYRTKALSLDTSSAGMAGKLSLKNFIEGLDEPLDEFPVDHLPILAKLVHESEKSVTDLAKHIKSSLGISASKADLDEDAAEPLPNKVLQKAIKSIAERQNWGISGFDDIELEYEDEDDVPRIPVGLCIYRWEVNDRDAFLAEGLTDAEIAKIEARYEEREKVKALAIKLVKALPEDERRALFVKNSKSKDDAEDKPKKKVLTAAEEEEKANKRKAAAEKKATAELKKVEKVAKAVEVKKQANGFLNFFGAKVVPVEAAPSSSSQGRSRSSSPSVVIQPKTKAAVLLTTAVPKTQFEKHFKPFHCGKDIVLHPVLPLQQQVAPVNLADLVDSRPELTLQDALADLFQGVPASRKYKRITRPAPEHSVKSIMTALNECDLTGDGGQQYYRLLNKIPVKLLSFQATDLRPGYIGSFTKTSRVIRPRNPFARDNAIFDYEYDSEAEWEEEEEGGEDIASNGSAEDPMDLDSDVEEGSMNDWLCDDDEVEMLEGVEGDMPIGSEDPLDPANFQAQQRAMAKQNRAQKDANARRKAVRLVPIYQGPHFEAKIGKPSYPGFNSLKIRFLNDAAPFLNPLTFKANETQITPKAVVQPGIAAALAGALATDGGKAKANVALGPAKGKKPFPIELLPELVDFVQTSDLTTKTALKKAIEEKYAGRATKISIEDFVKIHISILKGEAIKANNGKACEVSDEMVEAASRASEGQAV